MLSQKESVFQAVTSLIDVGNTVVELTKDQRSEVIAMVTQSIVQGETEFSAEAKAKYKTESDVKGYVNGMVSNWLRKDTRLNGGTKYEIKNPGSRAGQGDEILANLKNLKATMTDAAHIAVIDEHIETRKSELAKAKPTKQVKINFDLLPDDLKALYPQG